MTSELEDLAAAVRSVLDRRWSDAALRTAIDTPAGYDTGLWSVLSDQVGVAALAVPEAAGGMGAGVRALQSVAEELGRRLVPSPFLGSAVLATSVLNGTGACDLLGDLASGTRTATVAFAGRAFTDRPLIMSGGRVSGTACFVLDGDTADDLLLAARDGGRLVLLRADRGVAHRRHTPTLDPTRRLAEVTVDRASGTVLLDDAEAALAHALDVTCAVLAAEQVGAAEHALRSTVEYTRSRVQFGRAIGSFQALKHRMADMFVLVEAARSAAYAAGESLDRADPDAPQAVATAKAYCSEAFQAVAAEMIQLHGGIGITWEHDAHLYFKRAHGSAHLFGDPASFLALRPLTHS
ncbi:Acyl-CoA dehydrogenase domain protein OS=Tsukamurella paurometabola (strain ATCC 8368 / DSM/ CCUG 35730 / CIP 100753 / JCM 10117 / KCTC 9821 / NBRC 16120/ NCIMB 702349 / NCTC 13040) OX=521096 GN=Tpau_3840 PE=3 SV=1 [Tsukamurella paurometabola]|uniref:Acyl-CoA dehydrogenase domain protein n=1 Tax=Tsukamurella paurometabola (strain ATCC 8368 / DSM 20162 / CCUG 35730 / CIP 100753 / JCM 10117 / KCTC 9821 / NBRC 16120 / NCIMB 702349 / NCTC 13040) TaxID=521096 RepID=D5UYW2_TSUPD|nr:acyl-CoA dehydrogenase family protein [Tsukamurella paurometabola]ADG80415.1 acyl-CoA dehydrogenase domain protein [Tsukamurella paurometabola DSM 20162]SUP39552.1 Acyl-CoA dehydrogenase, short-chain specific [Tsukamurella paurometabola]